MSRPANTFSAFYIDVHDISEVTPGAENHFMCCLREEFTEYMANIQGTKCIICPFRSFARVCHLRAHLKYHIEERMYLADYNSKQRAVARAYYDYRCSIFPLVPFDSSDVGLLKKSASLIES